MLKVSNNSIELTRGDTMIMEVKLTDQSGFQYTPAETDKIYFRLKKNYYSDEVLVEKEIPYDTLILQIEEEDTKGLKPGLYHYEVELVTANNYHFTAIANTDFTITAELENHE